MALTVENGTGVANANSYCTLAEIRAYAADRGVALSDNDAVVTPLAIKATDYIESKASEFVGTPVNLAQWLSWPRKGVQKIDGSAFPENEIPRTLKFAQCQLVIEQQGGISIMKTIDRSNGFVIRSKVDVLETQYSDQIVPTSEPTMPAVDALLAPLMRSSGRMRSLRI